MTTDLSSLNSNIFSDHVFLPRLTTDIAGSTPKNNVRYFEQFSILKNDKQNVLHTIDSSCHNVLKENLVNGKTETFCKEKGQAMKKMKILSVL